MPDDADARRALAEAVRAACARAAAEALRDGGYAGLCAEGRLELALDAIRGVSLDALLADPALRRGRGSGEGTA